MASGAGHAGDHARATLSCSAHYFELQKSTLAQAWYAQGLRLLDVSNARNIRQIGYYRVSTGRHDDGLQLVGRRLARQPTSTCST